MRKCSKRQNRRCEQPLQITFDVVKIHVGGFARPLLRQGRTIGQTCEFQRLCNIWHCGFRCLDSCVTVKNFSDFKHPHTGLRTREVGFQILYQRTHQLGAHHRKATGDGVEQFNLILS